MKEKLFSLTKKDFVLHWFSGTGAGGQCRNKNQLCLRLFHPASGASATGQSNRSRRANQKEALNSLMENPRFRLWFNRKIYEALGNETIEEKVEKQIQDKNLKVEGKENGKWSEFK